MPEDRASVKLGNMSQKLGRSELAAQLARSSGQTAGTARNWATVTRLMAMLDLAA